MKDIGKKLMDIARWYSMPADHFNTMKEAVELLEKIELKSSYNSIKTELNGDAISRQAVRDMLKDINADTDGVGFYYEHYDEYIKNLPSVSTENPNRCDLISREWLKTAIHNFYYGLKHTPTEEDIQAYIDAAPSLSVSTEKTGRCKNCKYFEYDSVAKVNGMSLVIAHEICSKWGNGCKTREDGYCFLFEPKESEE